MIESGVFTRPSKTKQSQIFGEQEPDKLLQTTTVNRGTMFHLVSAHIFSIYKSDTMEFLEKKKIINEFGSKLGQSLVEQQCLGFVKYCAKNEKNQGKQFVGEMKLINGKIWHCLTGSKGKLFSISNQNLKSGSYKIEDEEFALGKAFANSTDPKQRSIRELMIEFCLGFINGSLDKLCLEAEVSCGDGKQGSVYVEMKNICRKETQDKFQQYSDSINNLVI